MAEQPLPPQFIDDELIARPVRPTAQTTGRPSIAQRLRGEQSLSFWATLDKPLLIVVGMLLAAGVVMVFSATFDWSLAEFGDETAVLQNHARNVVIGVLAALIFARIDLRIIRRLAVVIMLMAISFLISVLLFGDDTFGARRALINGRFQPGEFSELAIIIYMSAWLGSKRVRVGSLTYGLIPFIVMVGIVAGLVILQPDLSTAVIILMTSGLMFFLAGADLRQLGVIGVVAFILSFSAYQFLPGYAQDRLDSYISGIQDPLQANYHTQQAMIALWSGGWTGVGLGESQQKFLALPAAHTDSIFAVIGEELGVIGALVVIMLYVAFVIRGALISRRAQNAFSALLAAGITIWVVSKALLNIAVMTALVPSSGLPLPFISFGGSSLVVMMVGVGLLLAIQRETLLYTPERRQQTGAGVSANHDNGRRDRRSRLPRASRSRSTP